MYKALARTPVGWLEEASSQGIGLRLSQDPRPSLILLQGTFWGGKRTECPGCFQSLLGRGTLLPIGRCQGMLCGFLAKLWAAGENWNGLGWGSSHGKDGIALLLFRHHIDLSSVKNVWKGGSWHCTWVFGFWARQTRVAGPDAPAVHGLWDQEWATNPQFVHL